MSIKALSSCRTSSFLSTRSFPSRLHDLVHDFFCTRHREPVGYLLLLRDTPCTQECTLNSTMSLCLTGNGSTGAILARGQSMTSLLIGSSGIVRLNSVPDGDPFTYITVPASHLLHQPLACPCALIAVRTTLNDLARPRLHSQEQPAMLGNLRCCSKHPRYLGCSAFFLLGSSLSIFMPWTASHPPPRP